MEIKKEELDVIFWMYQRELEGSITTENQDYIGQVLDEILNLKLTIDKYIETKN